MLKNTASQTVSAQLVAVADGEDVTTGTTTVYVTGDAGTQASGGGTVAHEGNGCWSYVPTQAETNYSHVAYTFVNTAAVTATVQRDPITVADYKATGYSTHDAAAVVTALGTGAGLTSLATASALATVDTVVDAVKVVTDQMVFTVANQLDANALSGGGGLDAAGVRTAVGLATANLDTQLGDIPNNSEFNARTLVAADYFDPAADAVANVTLVATCTTNTDMRGTDGANTTTPNTVAPDNASIALILADTADLQANQGNWLTATGFATPTNITAGTITTVTNLTNAPTNGDLTATMKASVTTAVPTATGIGTQVWATASRSLSDPAGFKKNTAVANFMFLLVDSTDHVSPISGEAVTAERSIDGAAFGACTNAVSEVASGMYKISFSAADMNGDIVSFKFTSAGADPRYVTIATET